MNLSAHTVVRTALDYVSAAVDRSGEIFDMQGLEGVMIVVKFAAIAAGAVTSLKAQQGQLSDGSDMADLAGTGIAVANDDDDQIFIIDLVKPQERYVRVVVDKDAVNVTAEMAWYIGYGPRRLSTPLALANEVTYERHISPVEGAA